MRSARASNSTAQLSPARYDNRFHVLSPPRSCQLTTETPRSNAQSITEFLLNIYYNFQLTNDYSTKFSLPQKEKITEFLCDKHDFSNDRVTNAVNKLYEKLNEIYQELDKKVTKERNEIES